MFFYPSTRPFCHISPAPLGEQLQHSDKALTRMHFNTGTFTNQHGAKQAFRACNSLCQQHFVTCKKNYSHPPGPKERGTTRMSQISPQGKGTSCYSLPPLQLLLPTQQPPISPQPHGKALHKAPCRLHSTSRSGGRPLSKITSP